MPDLNKPCENCPFRKKKGVRLRQGRVLELCKMMLSPQGGDFICHKFMDKDRMDQASCAGAMIFALKHDNMTQVMRVCHRIGLLDPDKLQDKEEVFDNVKQMLEVHDKELDSKQ